MRYIIGMLLLSFSGSVNAQRVHWKEYDEVYNLVLAVLHPAANENLKPVKDSAAVLLRAAEDWLASDVPAKYDAKVVKSGIADLVARCQDLNAAVKAGKPDDDLVVLAAKAHNQFHLILGRYLR
jgi:hypothetical protein